MNYDNYLNDLWEKDCKLNKTGGYELEEFDEMIENSNYLYCDHCSALNSPSARYCYRCNAKLC